MEKSQSDNQNSKNLWTLCAKNQHLIANELKKSCPSHVECAKSLLMQIYWELEQEMDDDCDANYADPSNYGTKSSKNSQEFRKWIENVVCDEQNQEKKELSNLFENTNKRLLENKDKIDAIRSTILELSGGHKALFEICEGSLQKIDGFMYKDVDEFEKQSGIRCCAKCQNCGSVNTKPISLVSHSCSFDALQQLFTLRLTDLKGKKLLDIGSGMGSILYAAYCLSESAQITGIELNQRLCDMVSKVAISHGMDKNGRLQVINGDLLDHADLLQDSDVITFNNSFEYFVPRNVQITLWQFIKSNIKSGSLLVTNPSLEKLFSPLQPELGIKIDEWVSPFIFPFPNEAYDKLVALTVIQRPDEIFCIYNVI